MQWVRRYLRFHRLPVAGGPLTPALSPKGAREKNSGGEWRHPRDLGAADVVAFLNHLANEESVAAGTQNQALNAISFLYVQVLRIELGDLGDFLRAEKRRRVCGVRWTPSGGFPIPKCGCEGCCGFVFLSPNGGEEGECLAATPSPRPSPPRGRGRKPGGGAGGRVFSVESPKNCVFSYLWPVFRLSSDVSKLRNFMS